MQIQVLLSIKHTFPDEKCDIPLLLKGIPSRNIITILCAINTVINQGKNDLNKQLFLLHEIFLKRQPSEVAKNLILNIEKAIKSNFSENLITNHLIFASWPLLKFIEYEISQNREPNTPLMEISPNAELMVLKAIFIYNKTFDEKLHNLVFKHNERPDFFYSFAWPAIFFQHSLLVKSNYFYDFTKGLVLIIELNKTNYKEHIDSFIKAVKHPNIQSYLFQIMDTANYLNQEIKEGIFSKAGIYLKNNETIRNMVEMNTIELTGNSNFVKNSLNFNSLRSKPFFKLNDDIFLVFHLAFISGKLYDGLIFDLIDHSKKTTNPINLPDFKSKYSESIIEKMIFRNILKRAFEKKYRPIYFPTNKGESDAYFIISNTLYILEFKDCYFKSETIENPTKDNILEEIINKICSTKNINSEKNKGVGQLINSILNLESLEWLKAQKFNASKLKIQPIIVVTDPFFTLPGVNKYCSEVFRNHAEILLKNHSNIEPLLILDFDFLFNQFGSINQKKFDFNDLVQNYFTYLNKLEKKVSNQKANIKDVENLYLSFNEYCSLQKIEQKDPNLAKELFNMFDLKSGLPQD